MSERLFIAFATHYSYGERMASRHLYYTHDFFALSERDVLRDWGCANGYNPKTTEDYLDVEAALRAKHGSAALAQLAVKKAVRANTVYQGGIHSIDDFEYLRNYDEDDDTTIYVVGLWYPRRMRLQTDLEQAKTDERKIKREEFLGHQLDYDNPCSTACQIAYIMRHAHHWVGGESHGEIIEGVGQLASRLRVIPSSSVVPAPVSDE